MFNWQYFLQTRSTAAAAAAGTRKPFDHELFAACSTVGSFPVNSHV